MSKSPSALPRSKSRTRLHLELLEERIAPHSGVTQFSEGISANAGLAGIVQGPDSNFWFADFNSSRIGRIGGVGTSNAITEFTLPAGRGPLNLTVGSDGNIWFTENSGDRIGRFNPLAGSDSAIQASFVEFAVPGSGSQPHDIVAGPDGALWFTQTGSDEIGRITTAGVVTEFTVTGVGSAPAGIASGSDGALWFTQAGSGQIGRITTAGVVTEFTIPVPNAGAFSDPEDIISGPGGHLYFTDFGRDQIGRITTSGEITQFDLPIGRGPQQIVAAPDGNLYFTEAGSGRLGRLPANALNPGRPTSGMPPLEEFDFIARDSVPLGIALGGETGNEDIFFTLNNGNAIGTFAAHLAQITIVATGSSIEVLDIDLDSVRTFTPFVGYEGPLNLAVMDMAGAHSVGGATNGVPDAIVGAATGSSHVKVFDGSDNTELASFFSFDLSYRGGVMVAADDVNGDGRNDIIVAAGTHIKVIDGLRLGEVDANGVISDSALLASFFAFPFDVVSGISIFAGDVNRDGRADIIVGAGSGVDSHVKIIDATRLNQVDATGQISDSALIASFYAFDRGFIGGVSVAVGFNVSERNLIVSAGPGSFPHVKVIDIDQVGQVDANGVISQSALLASFFAFDSDFRGGVRIAADDLTNADGVPEIFVTAGPGAGPHVKVFDGSRLSEVDANGTISDSALLSSFFSGPESFHRGVTIAADADHRDSPFFGPPGVTLSRAQTDINDVFLFQSPETATNVVLGMDVVPFSTATTEARFAPDLLYDFRIINRDLVNVTDDLVFRVTFGPTDSAGIQDVLVRALPAARFAGTGGVLVKSFSGQTVNLRGVGGGETARFRAAEQDDPFFFDAAGFTALLNNATAVQGVVDGDFPRGMGTFGPSGTPNYDAPNFFGPAANTMSMVFELPASVLTAPGSNVIGVWGRAELNNVQIDRMGRPGINTALIPPVPRGSGFPIAGSTNLNRQDVRVAFNNAHPRDDRDVFLDDMTSIIAEFYPAGRPGGVPNLDQAEAVARLLLPDFLVLDVTNTAGFFLDTVEANGETFLAGGRKYSDDIISTELAVLTDDDLPESLGGGPNLPALVTQNVADDNGLNITDGSTVGPGGPQAGMIRDILFPYIGARNPNPTALPGGPPPP
jgi:streptogramin lyase